eukprot:534386_1
MAGNPGIPVLLYQNKKKKSMLKFKKTVIKLIMIGLFLYILIYAYLITTTGNNHNTNITQTKHIDVALIFNGLIRSIKFTKNNLNRNIFNVLSNHNITYNTYVHAYTLNRSYSNPRNNIRKITLDNSNYKLLKPNFLLLNDQDIIEKQLNLSKYVTHGNPWSNWISFNNCILNIYSKYLITKQLQLNSQKIRYKYVIFMRSDVLFHEPFDIQYFSLIKHENDVLVPDFAQWSGINDRFLLTSLPLGIKYGQRFQQLYEYSLNNSVASERFVKHILLQYHANIIQIPLYFLIVRANGKLDWRQCVDCKLFLNETKCIPKSICANFKRYGVNI